jgi:hypothetical protein
MGRGIQRTRKEDPIGDVRSWDLTEDMEMCDNDFAHLPVRATINDDDPHCLLGGGHLNLEAGLELIMERAPAVTVCAYGARSFYLSSIRGPSESEVMELHLLRLLEGHSPKSHIITWERDRPTPEGSRSNTMQEIRNVFELASEHGISDIVIFSLSMHLQRCRIFVKYWKSRLAKFASLSATCVASDILLAEKHPETHMKRVRVMWQSQACARTCALEEKGIADFFSGRYK